MKITVPDGKVVTTFPKGTKKEEIRQYMKEYRQRYTCLIIKSIKTTDKKNGVELEIQFRIKEK